MAVDVWIDVGAAVDGVQLQMMRNTTLGTGTLTFRTRRTVTRGKVRTLHTVTLTDATWETAYALTNP